MLLTKHKVFLITKKIYLFGLTKYIHNDITLYKRGRQVLRTLAQIRLTKIYNIQTTRLFGGNTLSDWESHDDSAPPNVLEIIN